MTDSPSGTPPAPPHAAPAPQPVRSPLERFVDGLLRGRLVLGIVAVVATVLAWPLAKELRFDQSIESLYAEDDPHLRIYTESKASFGGDEFAFVAWDEERLFEQDGVTLGTEAAGRIARLSATLSAVPGVNPASTQDLSKVLSFPYQRLKVRELMEGVLVGADGRTTAVALRLLKEGIDVNTAEKMELVKFFGVGEMLAQRIVDDRSERGPYKSVEDLQRVEGIDDLSLKRLSPWLKPVPRGETIARIRSIAAAEPFPVFVVGEPVQVHDMFRYVEEDGSLLFLFSVALLGAVILFYFRSLRWMLLPLLVVGATILWTQALLVLSRMRLSMVSSMLNSLTTVVAVATVVHVTTRYRELRRDHDRTAAARQTLIDLLPAVFWTCATTCAGFGSLLSSDITPVRSFGTMMALSTTLVLAAVAAILPAGMLTGRFDVDPRDAPGSALLERWLGGLTRIVDRHPKSIGFGAVVVVLLAGAGLFRLRVETDFSKNFRASSPIVTSLEFVETRLGGAGTWEVNFAIPPRADEAKFAAHLDRVRALLADLRGVQQEFPQLTKVTGITDGLDLVPEKLPLFGSRSLDTRLSNIDMLQPEFVPSLYDPEAGRMRIVLRALERQPAEEKQRLIDTVERRARDHFPEARTTGLFVLLTFLIESLMRSQLVSFSITAAAITAMMTIAFRSVRIGLISLVPNVFPIVLVIGTMGWVGLPINIATAMIASVSMGLTVDSSIHYLSGWRRARRSGLDPRAALAAAHQGIGKSLVLANVALIAGFAVLTASHFIPLVYFGFLVGVAIFGGLVGNLVLLPLMLRGMLPTSCASRPASSGSPGGATLGLPE